MHTRCSKIACDSEQTIDYPFRKGFDLSDKALIQSYVDQYSPMSCEYNFSNLFSWNDTYEHLWCLYKDRVLIFDPDHNQAFMPMGEDLAPDELAALSTYLLRMGLSPDIGLVCRDYIEFYPEVDKYYSIQENRDHAEYIYLTHKLYSLKGEKLHKKKNLISQFKKRYPDYQIRPITADNVDQIARFARTLLDRLDPPSTELENEYRAVKRCLDHFEELDMEGLVIFVQDKIAAFSMFSRLNPFTYDIQFEKSDHGFKGAGQVINWETARFLKDKCRYINREQDLGIQGLRQAKLSYDPEVLFIPHFLKFKGSR
ncbi:DUF2156 domain-containing protein [Desulfospira joergensenii]|uniref:DUF2156 domain-containing protein n=1 Tax=Desulfospira joergensenii TaxID=53329 RepID=UPI0003B376DB|nr:phosphatidylglycerol lysyltransferase domain-containing protein [Desulfospira joergensenii]